ncbi:MAG: sialate O-acetylesterase [Bacteroidales bacterium]|nr:sialate O-acetylesterase [Bacteroidales bacterium]
MKLYFMTLMFMMCSVLSNQVCAQIKLRLPSILSDHAVLQESSNCKLWGWGPGSQTVKIVCSWSNKDTIYVPIDASCLWETTIKTPKGTGSYKIEFICENQYIKIQDILVGEVWLCAGQSNMEFNYKWGLNDPETLNTCDNNFIRFFQIDQDYDEYPKSDCKGKWVVCNKNTMPDFSSVGYFFGKELTQIINKPVGLVGSYWGGTCIQTWMPKESFDNNSMKRFIFNIEPYGWAPKGATLLYNSMINPVSKYNFAGVIWYQGEANVESNFSDYSQLLSSMINLWRNKFKKDVPFYLVQIAPWNGYSGIKAAFLREQQELVSKTVPNVALISIADLINDITDIHPKNKRGVGERLANFIVSKQYCTQFIFNHPIIESWKINKKEIVLNIKSLEELKTKDKEMPRGFQIAGDDKLFHAAKVVKNRKGQIVIESKEVLHPVAFRYCFTNDEIPDFFDCNGLPLLQCRSDNWE